MESAKVLAEDHFRSERYNEPREIYLATFDEYQSVVADVLQLTADLNSIDEHALSILSDESQREVFRYLRGLRFQKTTSKSSWEELLYHLLVWPRTRSYSCA